MKWGGGSRKVLILGYSPDLSGGVTKVTNALVDAIPELELHPILYCYHPKIISVAHTARSFLSLFLKLILFRSNYRMVQVVVGSSGDSVRSLPFLYLSKLFRLKTALQFHSNCDNIYAGLPALLAGLVSSVWRKVDVNFFLSESLAKQHFSQIGKVKSYAIIPNPVFDDWVTLKVVPLSERTKDLVFLGRWSKEKGVFDLVRAMAELPSHTECEFYSNSPYGLEYLNCKFNNWVSEKEVIQIVAQSKVLVLPSYAEAYPLVLLEAAATGTPFIASNVGGVADIVKESKAGLLVEPGDITGLRRTILQLLSDEELWLLLSSAGRTWVKRLKVSDVCNMWLREYSRLD